MALASLRRIAPLVLAWLLSSPARIHAAEADADVSVVIVAPLTIVKEQDLSFGAVSVGSNGGGVVIDPDGAKTVSGGVSDEGGTHSHAKFQVTGEASTTYYIDTPGAIVVTNGVELMRVMAFTTNKNGGVGALSQSGADTFSVGASLLVGGNQPSGLYTGTFTVSVHYQ